MLDKGFFKDSVIGVYQFSVSNIYFRDDHVLHHQWLALSDPSAQNFNEITGSLKLSISVIGEGDEQVPLKIDESPEQDMGMIVVPPHISIKYYQLKF